MVKYKRFNRDKWDKDVLEWKGSPVGRRFISPRDRSFVEYWDIECWSESEEVDVSGLRRISGDYLFPDYWARLQNCGESSYYSVLDHWEWCRVSNRDFPDKWLWMIREIKLGLLDVENC